MQTDQTDQAENLDVKLAEIIGALLFQLSSSDVRRHILYKASILEATGAYEKAKQDPNYQPLNDPFLADQLLGHSAPLAVSFVPDGARVHVSHNNKRTRAQDKK